MRAKTAQVARILAHPSHTATATVYLWTVGGTPVAINQEDILGVEWKSDVDNPATATIRVRRQYGLRSNVPIISPFVWALGCRVLIACTPTPADLETGSSMTVFDGYIDDVAWADDEMQIELTDKTAKLRSAWIETELAYGMAQGANATKGVLVWKPGIMLPGAGGELIIPSEAKRNGHFYRVLSGPPEVYTTVEETWETGTGSTTYFESGDLSLLEVGTTSDSIGVPVETLIQQILNDNGLSAFTLYTPVSPSWAVKPYIQQRESVQSAIQAIVDQFGWVCRVKWVAAYGEFRLTLEEPQRTGATSVRTFTREDEREISDLSASIFDVRNVVRVIYSSSESKDPTGQPMRVQVEVSDAGSIAKYGRQFMEVAEAKSSAIDTNTEAVRMANAILSDLKEPKMGVSYETAIDPYLEVGDVVTLPTDNIRFAADQVLAVQGARHWIDKDGAATELTLYGAPVSNKAGWLMLDARAKPPEDQPGTVLLNGVLLTVAARPTIGGARIDIAQTLTTGTRDLSYEVHVSLASGFTPNASTLKYSGNSTSVVVSDLLPGSTYYVKVIPFSRDGAAIVRGEPSEQVSFVATRNTSLYYDPVCAQNWAPLNGNFEHATAPIESTPPDHWTVGPAWPTEPAESWGASGSVYYGINADHGRVVTIRATSARGIIRSPPFTVRPGGGSLNVYISARRNGGTASPRLFADVVFYADSALTTTVGTLQRITMDQGATGAWVQYNESIPIASLANFAVVYIYRELAGALTSVSYDIGDVFVEPGSQLRVSATEASFQDTTTQTLTITGTKTWIQATLINEWVNQPLGTNWRGLEYYKDQLGFVHVRGMIQYGVSPVFFVLPNHYRPSLAQSFGTVGDGAVATIDIAADGSMSLGVGSADSYINVNAIFDAP